MFKTLQQSAQISFYKVAVGSEKLFWNDQPCMALKIKSPQRTEEALKRRLVFHGGRTISK